MAKLNIPELKELIPGLNLENLLSYLILTNQIEPIKHLYTKLTIDNQLFINGFSFDPMSYSKIDSLVEKLKEEEIVYNVNLLFYEIYKLNISVLVPDGLSNNPYLWKYFLPANSYNNYNGVVNYNLYKELISYIINKYGKLKTIIDKLQEDHKIKPLTQIDASLQFWKSDPDLEFPMYLLENSSTPLGLAILHKKDDIIKFLLENLKLNLEAPVLKFKWPKDISIPYCYPTPEEYVLTPLQLAILTKNIFAVETLVEKGANIREFVELTCQNEDIRDGKFKLRVPSDIATKTSRKLDYNQIKYDEVWIMKASPLALTLLVKNPEDLNDKEKTLNIGSFLSKKGANFNEKINTTHASSHNSLRLDDIDQHNILWQIRDSIKAEKSKPNTAQPHQKFFKNNTSASENIKMDSQSKIEQPKVSYRNKSIVSSNEKELREEVNSLKQQVNNLQQQVNSLQTLIINMMNNQNNNQINEANNPNNKEFNPSHNRG